MVKELYLGLFAAIVCALAALTLALPVGSAGDSVLHNGSLLAEQPQEVTLADDASVRSERSTNLSHITGSARKIQMYVKNRHLQILPDGTVNGTSDDTSDYTILQRTTVNIGQLKIQGVATCQYLCMDSCGLLYGSKEFMDECVFNEMMEQHHYNTYSSARYSNARRTMYLALNRRGQPRKVQIRAHQQLGKLSTYTRVLTKPVNVDRVEDLITRLLHAADAALHAESSATGGSNPHPLRHHGGHLCPTFPNIGTTQEQRVKHTDASPDLAETDRTRCRRRKRKKKRRRKCHDGDDDAELCHKRAPTLDKNTRKNVNDKLKLCEHDKFNDECQRVEKGEIVTNKKKRKQKLGDKQLGGLRGVKKKRPKVGKNRKLANNKGKGDSEPGGDGRRGGGPRRGGGGGGGVRGNGPRGGPGRRAKEKTTTTEDELNASVVSADSSASVELESTVESPRTSSHEQEADLEPDEDYSGLVDNSTVTASSMEESSTWDEPLGASTDLSADADGYDTYGGYGDGDIPDQTSYAPRLERAD